MTQEKQSNHEIRQIDRTLHVELAYTRFEPNVDTVTIGCMDVSSIGDLEVTFNHNAHQWEIYRDVIKDNADAGILEHVAERVLICAIPAWTEPTRPTEESGRG